MDFPVQLTAFAVADGLDLLEVFESGDLGFLLVAQMKMLNPLRLATQNQFCRPRVRLAFALRPGEAVDVGAVLREKDEVAQVRHDEFGFVVGPNGKLSSFYCRLSRK